MSLHKSQCLQTKVSKLYDNYISKGSVNYKQIPKVISGFENSTHYITALFLECLLQLLKSSDKIKTNVNTFFLKAYLDGNIELAQSQFLFDGIIKKSPLKTLYKISKRLPKFKLTFVPFEDTLGLIYQTVKQLTNAQGEERYYTPEYLSDICVSTLDISQGRVFLDPCCSSGNLLLRLLKRGADVNNLFGCDLDEFSVTLARVNLYLNSYDLTDEFLKVHLKKGDGITYRCSVQPDVVISNPPYSVIEDDTICCRYQKTLKSAARKRPFLADLFVERYLKVLKENGLIHFILPEAILSVASHAIVRSEIEKTARVKAVRYLGDVFHDVQSHSIILTLEKSKHRYPKGEVIVNIKDRSYVIRRERPLMDFNFRIQDSEAKILKRIDESKNCVYLKDHATFVMGIVTGSNERSLKTKKSDDTQCVIRGFDIHKFYLDTPDNYVSSDYSSFQQMAKETMYRKKGRIIYRFISRYPVCAIDDSQLLTLNSANFFILNDVILDPYYVVGILNSSLMKFYFEKKFSQLKVLRSHLESVPFILCDKESKDEIVSLVKKIMSLDIKSDTKVYDEIKDRIDIIVNRIYKID